MSIFKKGFVGRIMIIGLIIAFLFTADAGRLFYIQIIKGEDYKNKAESQQLSDTEIEAKRGTIYDSEGNVLAQSATVWTVFLDPSNINQETTRTKVVDYLASTFGYDDEQKAKLTEKAKAANQYQVVEKNVENRVKEKSRSLFRKTSLQRLSVFRRQQKDIILTVRLLPPLSDLWARIPALQALKLITTMSLRAQTAGL